MPRYPVRDVPTGWRLDVSKASGEPRRFQAVQETAPNQVSPVYTRRISAVNWAWLHNAGPHHAEAESNGHSPGRPVGP